MRLGGRRGYRVLYAGKNSFTGAARTITAEELQMGKSKIS